MAEKKTYKPTNDYVFSRIFGYKRNWELLKDLLEAILTDIKIKKIELVKQYSLDKETIENLKSKLSTWQKNKDVRFVLTSTGSVLLM